MIGINKEELLRALSTICYRISQEIGASQSNVRKYNTGERFPNLYTADKIARLFGVSLDWLCGNDTPVKEPEQIYLEAVEHFGECNQIIKAIEECNELSHALSRFLTSGSGECDHIAEEIADVEIMIYQLKHILGNADAVNAWKKRKTDRLETRL